MEHVITIQTKSTQIDTRTSCNQPHSVWYIQCMYSNFLDLFIPLDPKFMHNNMDLIWCSLNVYLYYTSHKLK